MNISYFNTKDKYISYNRHISSKKEAPCIIFHHGFMSDMNGDKALSIENFCIKKDYNFIRFDNFGSGESSGQFIDQTITSWLEGLNHVIYNLTDQNPRIILIGSSLGGWITTLAAINDTMKKISGIITIAAAFDFTEELLWNNFTTDQKIELEKNGFCVVTGNNYDCNNSYPININLIKDARSHLLLNQNIINISCPMHLIHGMNDIDVSYNLSERIVSKIVSNNIVLKLIKDGNHKLSRKSDLQLVYNSIDEILSKTYQKER